MKQLINSIESSINNENWHAALLVALIIPDIAGKIEYPVSSSSKRYAMWFDKYVGDQYKAKIGPKKSEHIFLTGNDCYALRCAYLHEGITDITQQRARDVLDEFIFVVPPKGTMVHCNLIDKKLQLQVENFCNDIINGLIHWLIDIIDDPNKKSSLSSMIKIHKL